MPGILAGMVSSAWKAASIHWLYDLGAFLYAHKKPTTPQKQLKHLNPNNPALLSCSLLYSSLPRCCISLATHQWSQGGCFVKAASKKLEHVIFLFENLRSVLGYQTQILTITTNHLIHYLYIRNIGNYLRAEKDLDAKIRRRRFNSLIHACGSKPRFLRTPKNLFERDYNG